MALETRPASGKVKPHGQPAEILTANEEIEEIEIPQTKTLYDRAVQVMEKFASTRLGQMIIERVDRVLKVVEDTAKWSLPQPEDSDLQLERPLPWVFFLSLIVWLRVFRIWLSIGSFMVGSKSITPHSMVYYIQTKRRRLRAIRIQGLKSIRGHEVGTTITCTSTTENVSFVGKLRKLFGSAICMPGQHREVPNRRVFVQNDKENDSKKVAERTTKRPRDDDSIDQNLSVDEMLEKYANEDSENDSDYIPNEDEEDDSSTSITSSSSDDETEKGCSEVTQETTKETETSKPEPTSTEIKENGGDNYWTKSKSLDDSKSEPITSAVNSDNEPMHTPTNGSTDSGQLIEGGTQAAATEVAPKGTQNQLAVPQLAENNQKSTPGHETAASMNPPTIATANTAASKAKADEKCYKTITTQTSIELDWSITIKTEISHKRQYPKLEKLNCSVQLTPASSTEDIFYSPIGSPQDFHSIFHPAPLVKGSPPEDHLFSPKLYSQEN